MNNDEQYVPDEEQVRAWCREGVGDYPDVMDEWLDRFLARLKRDAAREALGALAAEAREGIVNRESTWGHGQSIASAAETYRDTHYPEENR